MSPYESDNYENNICNLLIYGRGILVGVLVQGRFIDEHVAALGGQGSGTQLAGVPYLPITLSIFFFASFLQEYR